LSTGRDGRICGHRPLRAPADAGGDRLGHSTRDVLNLVHELEQKGASLRVLEPEFCTSTDTGRILVTVLGMVAEIDGNVCCCRFDKSRCYRSRRDPFGTEFAQPSFPALS
jgi:hypothetical protein